MTYCDVARNNALHKSYHDLEFGLPHSRRVTMSD